MVATSPWTWHLFFSSGGVETIDGVCFAIAEQPSPDRDPDMVFGTILRLEACVHRLLLLSLRLVDSHTFIVHAEASLCDGAVTLHVFQRLVAFQHAANG